MHGGMKYRNLLLDFFPKNGIVMGIMNMKDT